MPQSIGSGLLHLQFEAPKEAFDRRYGDVEARAPETWKGFLGARRFERIPDYTHAAAEGLRWLVLHQLRVADAAQAYQEWDGLTTGGGRGVRNVFRQIYPGSGWLAGDGVHDGTQQPVGSAVLSVMFDIEPSVEKEFHAWYDEEHLPRLVDVTGILSARRFALESSSQPPGERLRFLALHEFADVDVVETDAWAAAQPSPRAEALVPHMQQHSQLYRAVAGGAAR